MDPKYAIRVGQYNVLCPTYGVKWHEREACNDYRSKIDHGGSNWSTRWPALLRVIGSAKWDILTLEEIEESTRDDITTGIKNLGLELIWFKHPKRKDAVGICYRPEVFDKLGKSQRGEFATVGRADLLHKPSKLKVSVFVTHQKGGLKYRPQLADLCKFTDEVPTHDLTIMCGDFNEDFGVNAGAKLTPNTRPFKTLDRDPSEEPIYSRPKLKNMPDQTSGKGKVDYIFARAESRLSLRLERDTASRHSLLMSHAPCKETGEWPSDHGLEALTIHIKKKRHSKKRDKYTFGQKEYTKGE